MNKTWNTKDAITTGPKKVFLLQATTYHQQLKYCKLQICQSLAFRLSPTISKVHSAPHAALLRKQVQEAHEVDPFQSRYLQSNQRKRDFYITTVGYPKFQSSLNYITVHQASYQKVPIMQVAPYEIAILQIAR